MNNGRTDGWAAIAAALLVLFTAMWDPRISVVVSLVALLGLGFAGSRDPDRADQSAAGTFASVGAGICWRWWWCLVDGDHT